MTTGLSLTEIEEKIHIIRGRRVMLDQDLASLYGVTTSRLNEQVKRNLARFPSDFMFRLNIHELTILMSQIATSRRGWGGRRKLPLVFTEHGAVMLANVLSSKVAVEASIQVVRAFVHLREFMISHEDLFRKINAMEKRYDEQFKVVFDVIRQLMAPPVKPKRQIGFRP